MELQWEQASLRELSVEGCQLRGDIMVLRRAAQGTLGGEERELPSLTYTS